MPLAIDQFVPGQLLKTVTPVVFRLSTSALIECDPGTVLLVTSHTIDRLMPWFTAIISRETGETLFVDDAVLANARNKDEYNASFEVING